MRSFKLLLCSLVAATTAVGVSSAPAQAVTTATYETQISSTTNQWRAQKGRVKLAYSPCMDKYATTWARTIATKGTLVHQSSTKLRQILQACNKSSIGENLAVGQSTGKAVVTAWKNSSGHNANMLRKSHRFYGVGSYHDGRRWWSVQLVATP